MAINFNPYLVQPKMNEVNQFSKEECERYSRHFVLPNFGEAEQLKLKRAKVVVVGAGGLGCPVLQYLTAAGIETKKA
jgi:adenylyltransferase/sulfurtransferase